MERITYQDIPMGMFTKLQDIEQFIHGFTLEKELLGLVKLRASQINGCAYCVDMHHKELVAMGETDLRLSSLCVWEETPFFTERERTALRFTEATSLIANNSISDKLFDRLLLHFSKEEISILTMAVAQINTWNRLMKVFRFTPGEYEVKKVEVAKT